MTHVDHDVEAVPAVRRDGVVQRGIRGNDERLEIASLATRPEPNSGLISGRRCASRDVHADVEPRAVQAATDRFGDGRLPGARSTVEDDDAARLWTQASPPAWQRESRGAASRGSS